MKQLFKSLGTTAKEMDTFLRLLELGAQPVSVIAKNIGIPRSTMYIVLENLKELGLVDEFERFGVKYFKCIPVHSIRDVIQTKKRNLEQTENMLEERLIKLEKLESKLSITPKIRFYEGKEDAMKVYEQVLREKTFLAFFNPSLVKKLMPEYHFKIPEMLKKHRGKAKELLVSCSEALEYKKKYATEKHQIKILPPSIVFPSDTIICTDKMYMIAYGEKKISATEIISPSLVQSQRAMFELIWEKVK